MDTDANRKLASLMGMLNKGHEWERVPDIVRATFIEVVAVFDEHAKIIAKLNAENRYLKSCLPPPPGEPPGQGSPSSKDSVAIVTKLAALQHELNVDSHHKRVQSRAAVADSKNTLLHALEDEEGTDNGFIDVSPTPSVKALAAGLKTPERNVPDLTTSKLTNAFTKLAVPATLPSPASSTTSPATTPTNETDGTQDKASAAGDGAKKSGHKIRKTVTFSDPSNVTVMAMSLNDFKKEVGVAQSPGSEGESPAPGGAKPEGKAGKKKKGNKERGEIVFVFENDDGSKVYGDTKGNDLIQETPHDAPPPITAHPAKEPKRVRFPDGDQIIEIFGYNENSPLDRKSDGQAHAFPGPSSHTGSLTALAASHRSSEEITDFASMANNTHEIEASSEPSPGTDGVTDDESIESNSDRGSITGSTTSSGGDKKTKLRKRLVKVFWRPKPKDPSTPKGSKKGDAAAAAEHENETSPRGDSRGSEDDHEHGNGGDDSDEEDYHLTPELAMLINALANT